MSNSKLYFLLIGSCEMLRAALIKEDLMEGRDFINAVQFLSAAQGLRKFFGKIIMKIGLNVT